MEDRLNCVVSYTVGGEVAADVDELIVDDACRLLLREDLLVSALVELVRRQIRLELRTQAVPEFVDIERLVGMQRGDDRIGQRRRGCRGNGERRLRLCTST